MLQKRVKRVLTDHIKTPELLSSLETLSGFYEENTREKRNTLRGVIETEGHRLNDELISLFEGVVGELSRVGQVVDGVAEECALIEEQLAEMESATGDYVSEMHTLADARDDVERKLSAVGTLVKLFDLSTAEKTALRKFQAEALLTTDALEAMAHMEEMRAESRKVVDAARGGCHEQCALDVVKKYGRWLEEAYECLYKWTLEAVRSEEPPIGLVPDALRTLSARSGYLSECISELCAWRRLAVARSFLRRLSTESVERHAHDSVRYVCDMLSLVCESAQNERTLLDTVVGEEAPAQMDRVCEGLLRPFSLRLSSTLAQIDSIACFRICQLLAFYRASLSRYFAKDSQFIARIEGLRQDCHKKLRATIGELLAGSPLTSGGCLRRGDVVDYLSRLSAVMDLHKSAVVGSAQIEDTLRAFVDPLLEACHSELQKLKTDASDECVALFSLAQMISDCIYPFEFARKSPVFETVNLLLETQKEKLVRIQSAQILRQCGVVPILKALRQYSHGDDKVMATDPQLDGASMKLALSSLNSVIFSIGGLPMPTVDAITSDLAVASECRALVCRAVFDVYSLFFDALADLKNGYLSEGSTPESHLGVHSPNEVKSVLQL